MKLKKLSQTISIVLATGFLASCGGGGSSSGSSSTTTTSIGKIDGFGSIYVNGVEYETSGADYHVDDESAFDDSALGVGMKVKVVGRVNSDGVTGTADSIYYDDDLEGPIDAGSLVVDGDTTTFTIFGMAVSAHINDTVYDDGASYAGLAEGQEIEVSGFFDGSQIVASRIELQSDSDNDYEIKGTVSQYDGSTITLELMNGDSAGPYDISSSAEIDSDLPSDPVGSFVEIKLVEDAGSIEVVEIESEDDDMVDDSDDDHDVEITGILMGNDIDGYTVNDVPVEFSNGVDPQLVGTLVEVEGHMVDGTLVVYKTEQEDGEIEIKSLVQNVTYSDAKNGTVTIDLGNGESLSFTTDNSTTFEDSSSYDSSSDNDGSFRLDELISNDYVEVELTADGSGGYYAHSIEREDSSSTPLVIEAPVDAADATTITLLNVVFTHSSSSTFSPGEKVEAYDAGYDGDIDYLEIDD
jgi:cytoskeletal protein CcmA (bactofilin family)